MGEHEKEINKFIDVVKQEVPQITKINYEYDLETDTYYIWHNLLPTEEIKYEKILGNLIYDYLYNKDIFNIGFGFRSETTIRWNCFFIGCFESGKPW